MPGAIRSKPGSQKDSQEDSRKVLRHGPSQDFAEARYSTDTRSTMSLDQDRNDLKRSRTEAAARNQAGADSIFAEVVSELKERKQFPQTAHSDRNTPLNQAEGSIPKAEQRNRSDTLFLDITPLKLRASRSAAELNSWASLKNAPGHQLEFLSPPFSAWTTLPGSLQDKNAQTRAGAPKQGKDSSPVSQTPAQSKDNSAAKEAPTQGKDRSLTREAPTQSKDRSLAREAPAQSVPAAGGAVWKKQDDESWALFDRQGKKQENNYGADVTSVSRNEDLSFTLKLKDKTTVKEKTDGSRLVSDEQGRITSLTYADGTTRQFTWDGTELASVKTRDNQWFDRRKQDGKYIDEWAARASTSHWKGKIEIDAGSGDYTICPSGAADGISRRIAHTDETTELYKLDGSKEVTLPNKATLSFDERGNITKFVAEDATIRVFGWSRDGDGSSRLTSVRVKQESQEESLWQLKENKWNWKGEPTNFSFSVDNRTGVYTWSDNDKGETHRIDPRGRELIERKDGAVLEIKDGKAVSARAGNTSFEYSRDKQGQISEITRTIKGQPPLIFNKSAQGSWQSSDGKSIMGTPQPLPSGEPAFTDADKSLVFKFDGTIAERITDSTNKSIIERTDGHTRVICPDGSIAACDDIRGGDRKLTITKVSQTRGGKTEIWTREAAADGSGHSDIWVNKKTLERQSRQDVCLSDKGEFSFKYAGQDGSKYAAHADGSETLSNDAQKWKVDFKDGRASEIKYADGKIRKFTYKGDEVESIEIRSAEGDVSTWQRTGKNKYKDNNGTAWNAHIEIIRDSYEITDLDKNNEVTIRKPNGLMIEEKPKEKLHVETLKDKITKVVLDGKTRDFAYSCDGKINQITETGTETPVTLQKQADGSWIRYAADGKPALDGLKRTGDVVVDGKGTCSFLSADGGVIRQKIGGAAEHISTGLNIEKKITQNADLDAAAKICFIENIDSLQKRQDIDVKEKQDTVKQITRLLDATGETPMTSRERAKIAEQLAWHVANPEKDAQGQHPTCSVTDIRISLERETPSQFARLIADIGTTGKFVTVDGTTITPSPDSLKSGKEEQDFPPKGSSRTLVGKISDVTLSNICWARKSTDAKGQAVPKGNMYYAEVRPTGRDDSGSRVYRWRQQADGSWHSEEQSRSPGLFANDIVDIYRQITGKAEDNRFIVNGDHNIHGASIAVVNSQADLQAQLMHGPWPKIVEVQNNILNGKEPDGKDHEHVVVVTGYDHATGKVSIDNSHDPDSDMLSPDKQIPLAQLYKATQKKQ